MSGCTSLQYLSVEECHALRSLDVGGLSQLLEVDCEECSQLVYLQLGGCQHLRRVRLDGCTAFLTVDGLECVPPRLRTAFCKQLEALQLSDAGAGDEASTTDGDTDAMSVLASILSDAPALRSTSRAFRTNVAVAVAAAAHSASLELEACTEDGEAHALAAALGSALQLCHKPKQLCVRHHRVIRRT